MVEKSTGLGARRSESQSELTLTDHGFVRGDMAEQSVMNYDLQSQTCWFACLALLHTGYMSWADYLIFMFSVVLIYKMGIIIGPISQDCLNIKRDN